MKFCLDQLRKANSISITDPEYSIRANALNLILNIPYDFLMAELSSQKGVELIDSVLSFLDFNLKIYKQDREVKTVDVIYPLLALMTKHSKNNDIVRRYLRKKILPAGLDRSMRPEDGNTLKSYLVYLLVGTNLDLKQAAGDFLFTLCKRNGNISFLFQ